jgi:AcrR family transcriptional regulator
MPDMTGSRRQQAEERREQILDAALRVFAQKGYAGATMRDIAREVGITEGLIYHYFESKEHLMHTCWRERTWRAHMERILAHSEGKPLADVLRELVRNFLETLYENRNMVQMCLSEMTRTPDMANDFAEKIEDNSRFMTEFFRMRQQAGEIRSDADLSTPGGLLIGCAHSLFLLWGHAPPEKWQEVITEYAQNSVDIVLHGIVPAPTPVNQ